MSDDAFTPLLTTTDWNEEWKRLQAVRGRADDASEWDKRAKTFPVKHGSQTGYVARFLELASVREGESVLDMGCGTGALATPLAAAGHPVIACDFSRAMLDMMRADHEHLGVNGVETHLMSWEDDWNEFGVGENDVDIAFASRSIATHDMRDALMKLDRVARRRACITLPCGPSPKSDPALLAAAGFANRIGRDFLYAFNILADCGRAPEVAYIPNTRLELFDSFDDALETYTNIVNGAMKETASASELAAVPMRLRTWLDRELVEDDPGFHLRKEREVVWAFIAWTTSDRQECRTS